MNIMELGAIGELVGGVAVIATLAFLAFEVRRNTYTSRRATQQSTVDQAVTMNLSMGQLAELIAKANEDDSALLPAERIQLQLLYVNYFNLWDAAYWSRREGFLDDHGFGVWNNGMTSIFAGQVASRRVWEELRHIYPTEFRKHADDLISKLGPVEGPGILI